MKKELNRENISKVLEKEINPQLQSHSGGAVLRDLKNGIATIKFTGACAGCYAADVTLENIVKETLLREFPELKEVELDNSVDDELLDFARKLMQH